MDTVLSHWVNEFHVDGFRLDLSKGFTQNWTVGDIGAWSARDQSRIDNLTRLKDVHWARHPGSWLILEHFANNDEETELAGMGYMLWGKATDPYKECTMGWATNNDFEWYVSYQARGWAFHNLVGFMESHDEERLMYENLNYGNSWNGYDTRDLSTALWRMGTAASCFFTIPGPKMMWMFGELGYDYSINYACRTCPKPIKWEYWDEFDRQKLFKIYAAIIKLKTNYTTFRSGSYDMNTGDYKKTIHVNDAGMNATIIANFDVAGQDVWTGFQHTGNWYDYMTGNVLNVTDQNMLYFLNPGEYRIFCRPNRFLFRICRS